LSVKDEVQVRIRSSSKSRVDKHEIQSSKLNSASAKFNSATNSIKMGKTTDSFFKPSKTNDSFFKATNSNDSFCRTSANFNTTLTGFKQDIKIRSLDTSNIKKDMMRFKNLDEPVIEQNLNPEALKTLTGFRDLSKVKFFSVRDYSEENVDFAGIGKNLSNISYLEANECKLSSIKNLGIDLCNLTRLTLNKCKLQNL
jgi:hypothetical protein